MATDLFGKLDPVGKTILINGAPYTVIGVMQHKTQMGSYQGPDAQHGCIPISTARAQFGRDRLNNMLIETHSADEMVGALKKFNEVMGPKLGYDPTDERASHVGTVKARGHRMITAESRCPRNRRRARC